MTNGDASMRHVRKLYREVLAVLPVDAARFLRRYSFTLSLLAIFDAAALGLLAITINPMISGSSLTLPVIGTVNHVGLLVILGVVCLLIIVKGVLAVALLWAATRRFARYELAIGSRLFSTYISAPWVERLKRNSSDLVRMSDSSVGSTISAFLLPGSTLLGEITTFVVIVVVLAVFKPLVALVGILYLGLVGALLFFWVSKKARQAGRVNLTATRRTSRLITEMVGALKEVTLRNKLGEVAEVVANSRRESSRARSNIQFLAQVPRYVLESAIIGGFVIVGAVSYTHLTLPTNREV